MVATLERWTLVRGRRKYSDPSLKGHSLERTPLYNGHKFLTASTMNYVMLPLTKGHLSSKDRIVWQKGVLISMIREGPLYIDSSSGKDLWPY